MKKALLIMTMVMIGALAAACAVSLPDPVTSSVMELDSPGPVIQQSGYDTEESGDGEEMKNLLSAPTYLGSEACAECHQGVYDSFMLTGHPYKLNRVIDGEPPEYPFSEVPEPPEGYTWDAIFYVIGGFGWKARFIDQDGFIITGDEDATTQYNLYNEDLDMGDNWVSYHAGEEKPYNCGSCHTTGYQPEGNQLGLPGLIGTWAEDGIGCEECHGPGSEHAKYPYQVDAMVDRDPELCGACHRRGEVESINASGGFIRHHEQYEEFFQSKKRSMRCIDCHNPHQTTVYAEEAGVSAIRAACENCHFEQAKYQKVTEWEHAECIECHMPRVTKSALGNPDIYSGDIRTHLMAINPDATSQFTEDGSASQPHLALDFACRSCHSEEGFAPNLENEELVEMAVGYHDRDAAGSRNE